VRRLLWVAALRPSPATPAPNFNRRSTDLFHLRRDHGPSDQFSPIGRTQRRSHEVRSMAFTRRLVHLPPGPLMAVDFPITCSLVRPGRPRYAVHVRQAKVSTHLSAPPHGDARGTSLVLRHHQAGPRTSTSKPPIMLGTHEKAEPCRRQGSAIFCADGLNAASSARATSTPAP
jgi:hypothetical protein